MAINSEKCPLCGGALFSHWPDAHMSRCGTCSLVVRNPRPTDEELNAFYARSWSMPESEIEGTGATDMNLALIFARKLMDVNGVGSFEGLRILDYGAGQGAMLRALADQGAEVYATEPFGFEFLRNSGFNVFRSIDDLPPDLMFDGIVTIDVVEHLATPWNELARLQKRLKSGGWLYVATPNAASFSAAIKRGKWAQANNPGHLYLFSPRGMEKMLVQSGFSRPRQLRWFIRYTNVLPVWLLHLFLQALRIDGELRYLAFKETP